MIKFRRILVPIETRAVSRLAVEPALRLARETGAHVTVVEVVRNDAVSRDPSLSAERTRACEEELKEIIAPLAKEGIEASAAVLHGRPFEEIIRAVIRDGHDLVVKVAGEEGWFRDTFLGSTDLNLLRKCPCPLWLVHPDGGSRYERILAALHLDPENDESTALDRSILDLATSLAALHGSEVHAAHCYDPMAGGWLEHRLGDEAYQRWLESARTSASEAFASALRPFEDEIPPDRRHLVRGDPGYLLPRIVDELRVDLLVLGTVARSGVPGLLVGNTAERVLAQVRASLLALKPVGFRSPIELRRD